MYTYLTQEWAHTYFAIMRVFSGTLMADLSAADVSIALAPFERDGELVRCCEGFPIFGHCGAKAIREQEGVGARGAEGQEIDQPAAKRAGVVDVAALHRPFQSLRIGERADRESRRQPEHQGQQGRLGVRRL